jgi:hypothetical protein
MRTLLRQQIEDPLLRLAVHHSDEGKRPAVGMSADRYRGLHPQHPITAGVAACNEFDAKRIKRRQGRAKNRSWVAVAM